MLPLENYGQSGCQLVFANERRSGCRDPGAKRNDHDLKWVSIFTKCNEVLNSDKYVRLEALITFEMKRIACAQCGFIRC
jgi:hypothetical protein